MIAARLRTASALSVLIGSLSISAGARAESGERRALIVAVSDYGADRLRLGAGRDAEVLEAALRQRGFAADDILVLEDAAATHTGILTAIERHLMTDAEGAHLLLHFSGHGQRIRDDNGDEADGYDEALVPYGAPLAADGDYDGALHLRDDQLGALLTALSQAVGASGSLAVTIDACSTGTITRDALPQRGAPALGAPAPPPSAPNARSELAGPWIALSAAEDDQLAHERRDADGQPLGAFTAALVEALLAPQPDETWGGVHERVRVALNTSAPGQRPQLEGGSGCAAVRRRRVVRALVPRGRRAERWAAALGRRAAGGAGAGRGGDHSPLGNPAPVGGDPAGTWRRSRDARDLGICRAGHPRADAAAGDPRLR